MGSPKALLRLDGETFLDRLILTFTPHCDPVLVVLGYDAGRIRAGIRLAGRVRFIRNPAPERGQLSSLQCGLRATPDEATGLIFSPVDYPKVLPATVGRLAEEFRSSRGEAAVVIPTFQEKRGHPVCVSRELFADFLALDASAQARDVIHANTARTRYVEVPDPGILHDVDDAASYRRLLETDRRQ